MSVVLLRWNPEISSYKMENFKNAMEEAKGALNYCLNWSVWEHEKVQDGDRFFMLRVGKGKTGIVMSGRIVSDPYTSEDWSGKGRTVYYVDLEPDFLVNPNSDSRVSVADLEKAFPKYVWKEGHSGMVLEDSLGTKLEWLWVEYLYKNQVVDHKKNLVSNRFETNEFCVPYSYYVDVVGALQLDLSKKKGSACEICGYDYAKVFDMDALDCVGVQNIYYMFPSKRIAKSAKSLFHCICANCRNIFRDICNDTNKGMLVPFENLVKTKRKA